MMFILFMKTVDVYLKEALIHAVMGETPVINFNWRLENNCTELAIFAAPEKINQLDENILEVYYMDVNSQGLPVKYIRKFIH